MSDWIHALPVGWMGVVVFGGTYAGAARNVEWPAMARQRATLTMVPIPLAEALRTTLGLTLTGEGQLAAQRGIVAALENALDARRQRILVSRAEVNAMKWTALLLQAFCTLVAIAMVHSDNRLDRGHRHGTFLHGGGCLYPVDRHPGSALHRQGIGPADGAAPGAAGVTAPGERIVASRWPRTDRSWATAVTGRASRAARVSEWNGFMI